MFFGDEGTIALDKDRIIVETDQKTHEFNKSDLKKVRVNAINGIWTFILHDKRFFNIMGIKGQKKQLNSALREFLADSEL